METKEQIRNYKAQIGWVTQRLNSGQYTVKQYKEYLDQIRYFEYSIMFTEYDVPEFRRKDSTWVYGKQ